MTEHAHESVEQQQPLVCYIHTDTETSLRCNRCEQPICAKCAVRTPTGYRCKECVRGQQKVFDTAQTQDYLIGVLIGGILAFIGGLIIPRLGFFAIFLGPAAGALIAEIIRRSIQRRRSQTLFRAISAAVAIGALLPLCGTLFSLVLILAAGSAGGAGGLLFGLLWPGLYAFLVTSAVYYRLSGIQI